MVTIAFQKECRLGKDRLARQERGAQPLPLLDYPFVVSHTGSEETDQGAGIQQARAFLQRPKPSMYSGFTARSSGSPRTLPARSRVTSKHERALAGFS